MAYDRFTFFWRGPLSQWYPSPFVVDSQTFSCAEQYMMWRKAMLFGDQLAAAQIVATTDPARHKFIGRLVEGFQEGRWVSERLGIVYTGNEAKFTQSDELYAKLVSTAGTELVEASPADTIWGIGLREGDPRALDRKTWRGQNLLGRTLTQLRDDLMEKRS